MMRHSTPQVDATPNNLDIRGVPGIGVGHLGELAARFLLDSAFSPRRHFARGAARRIGGLAGAVAHYQLLWGMQAVDRRIESTRMKL
ncbi:hypothetical protein TRIATDRAFT_300677 [Trichoderma atroviride IMI 206040]|uniref:Uncharacterized protein n=1 Tax=Hypocrea atroviridis (strain ATCC 20476 / IMI 206040) TaxID=452589 RepID=G9NYR8_HYPAI|nr:uncharacterized protein TRIATDRAFT_300677 [Trichoderma atroviride IMI 206040]EHK44525.1 hypothetical protein TRIATDRAFT_300677 [Trichoderma atroviride IMI 206040]